MFSPSRGILTISERGKQALSQNSIKIDNGFLKQFPEFLEFQNYKSDEVKLFPGEDFGSIDGNTPQENIDIAYQKVRQTLAQELIYTVRSLSPSFF